jgi:hypothetical protein
VVYLILINVTMRWIFQGWKFLKVPAEVTGALIVAWTLLVQYSFRKRTPAP